MKKLNLKSESGFTMTDLIAALIIFSVFTGIIGTLFYSSFKMNLQTKMAGTAGNYAIQILEDIDKMTYDEVVNGMENNYRNKLSIPTAFDIKIEIVNYNEGNNKEDLIKKVKLTINYSLAGKNEELVMNHLKIKEV